MRAVSSLNWTRRYFDWLLRHRKAMNILSLVMTVLCMWLASRLTIKSSFSELLPEGLSSVRQLKAVTERIGGTGVLLVGVESPDFAANKKFVEAMARQIEKLPNDEVRYFEYRYKQERDYIEKYGLHYLNEKQLKQLRDGLREEIDSRKNNAVASFLGLDDEPAPKIAHTDFKDALAKDLDPRIQRFMQFPDAYIGTDDGKLLVIRILPTGSSLSVKTAKKLTDDVRAIVNGLNPASFHPQMKIGFAGNVQRGIDEYETIRHDIFDTSLELVALIVAVLFIFFWSLRWILLLILNLLLGVAWTFGFTYLVIGYLNTQTAFLGSLVAGTGINYGIIMLARYLEERRRGAETRNAIVTSVHSTSIATLLASSTTAVSFASLLVADNKGLSQFGFIGCIGILFCWIATYLMLPLWIHQWEELFPQRSLTHPLAEKARAVGEWVGGFMIRLAPMLSVILVVVSVLGIYGFRKLAHDPLEYNFSKLQNRISLDRGSMALNKRIQDEVFKGSLSISVVLTESPEQAQELCPAVRKQVSSIPIENRVFESCSSLWELVPKHPESPKVATREAALRAEIKGLLGNRLLKFADAKARAFIQRMRGNISLKPPRLQDLPQQLTRKFEEHDGTIGLVGFITPDNTKPLEDARNLFDYTTAFRKIVLPQSGTVVSAAGDAWVIADLLDTLRTDGPRISLLAFVSVVLLTFLLSGSLRGGLLMAFCLLLATWWQLCFQGLVGIKFNFFNFIALPITFGIGIDYPINVFLRARENGFRNYGSILATTGAAVILCSATTTIGYYTLLGASNQALTSFAHLAIIGEATCLAGAILLLPVSLRLIGKFRQDLV